MCSNEEIECESVPFHVFISRAVIQPSMASISTADALLLLGRVFFPTSISQHVFDTALLIQ